MKFGLVGIGKFGKNYIKNIKNINGSELLACCSRTAESYNNLPEELSSELPWTDNFDNLLKLKTDTIIIATHPDSHFEYAIKALGANKHVICEKPCMFSDKQMAEVSRVAEKSKVEFMTNYNNLYFSKLQAMQNSIADNKATNVKLINIGNGPNRKYSSLWDYGCHEIALATVLNMNNPAKIVKFNGRNNRYDVVLEYPKSLVNITVGSGFESRLNAKFCSNESDKIFWIDMKEEPLLKRMLENFISRPTSNINISIEVSNILNKLKITI